MIVSNSSPLIYLAKLTRLQLLKDFFWEVAVPEKVWEEVVEKGKEENFPDAFVVESAAREGRLKVKKVKNVKKLEGFGIDEGEAEAVSLAFELGVKEILVDQTHARLAAKALGLRPMGTIFVLLRALKEGSMTYDDYLEDLESMVKSNFRMSSEVYLRAVKLGRKVRRI